MRVATAAQPFALQLGVAFKNPLREALKAMKANRSKPRGAPVIRRVFEITLIELGRVGLAALSLPHVAELSGINKTSLYRRWPTKEALVAAALQLAVPEEGELPDHGNLEDDLVDLVAHLAGFISSAAGMGVLRTVFADGETEEARSFAKSMWRGAARKGPQLVLKRALKRGELRKGVDIDLLLYTIAGAVLHRAFVERKKADARWARQIIRMISRGVATSR